MLTSSGSRPVCAKAEARMPARARSESPRLVFWPKAVFQLPSTETTALKWLFHQEKATLHKAGKAT